MRGKIRKGGPLLGLDFWAIVVLFHDVLETKRLDISPYSDMRTCFCKIKSDVYRYCSLGT